MKHNPILSHVNNKSIELEKLKHYVEKYPEYLNIPSKKGYTVIDAAIKRLPYEHIKYLLEKGADPNINTKESCLASIYQRYDRERRKYWRFQEYTVKYICTFKLLLDHGADPNGTYSWEKNPIIKQAIQRDDIEVVKLLISKGADVNKLDTKGISPLYTAVTTNKYEITCLLLENGANINGYSDFEKCISESSTFSLKNPLYNVDVFGLTSYNTYNKNHIYQIIITLLQNGAYIPHGLVSKYITYMPGEEFLNNNIIALLLQYGADLYDGIYYNCSIGYSKSAFIPEPSEKIIEYIKKYKRISRLHTMCVRIVKQYNLAEKLDYEFPPLLLVIEEAIVPELDSFRYFNRWNGGEKCSPPRLIF